MHICIYGTMTMVLLDHDENSLDSSVMSCGGMSTDNYERDKLQGNNVTMLN
jgi:hypothetical protein